LIVAVEQESREAIDAEGCLMGVMTGAYGAGAHSQARGLDPGSSDDHGVGSAEALTGSRKSRERVGSQPRRTHCGPGEGEEVSSVQRSLLGHNAV